MKLLLDVGILCEFILNISMFLMFKVLVCNVFIEMMKVFGGKLVFSSKILMLIVKLKLFMFNDVVDVDDFDDDFFSNILVFDFDFIEKWVILKEFVC